MIDPTKITDYDRTVPELEELLLFCIAVAGKNATTTAKNLETLLEYGRGVAHGTEVTPFQAINCIDKYEELPEVMKSYGFGCYNLKARGFLEALNSKLNLKTCTVEDLEAIAGIGMKTARFFILHTRKDARIACLDTHVLQWLSYYTGYDVPKQTPTRKKYLELEQVFLKLADLMKTRPAVLDLAIWNRSRGSEPEK